MVALEKQTEILRRKNVVDLSTNGMDGIIGEQTGRQGESRRPNRNLAAVRRDLPLVLTDDTELQELAEILL